MQHETPTLSYETPRGPNPWAKPALIGGIVLLVGSLVPICGLAVVPLACIGLIVGLLGVGFAIWGKRRGLMMSVFGSVLSLGAVLIPVALLGTVPFLAELGLRIWASNNKPAVTNPAPASMPLTAPALTTQSARE